TGNPTTVAGGGEVTLDGTASDPDAGDTLTYAWSSDGGGTFADPAVLDTTWTAPAATSSEQSITLTLTVTDAGGLSATATVDVTVPARALTASFVDPPTSHSGSGKFTLRISFSENLASGAGRKIGQALTITGATREFVLKVGNGRNLFKFVVRPSGTGDITLSLESTGSCGDSGAICTSDGRMLSHTVDLTISGPEE
ncbi:MAG: hypothetical protein OXS35_00525, partial [Dehalococcoidia bacterium]|nr:hypothetical protein [Dehalococcoidia bacterium]